MIARHRSALFVAAVIVACTDPAAPPAPGSPSLARQSWGKSGIVITDLGTLGGNRSMVMGLNTPLEGRPLLIVGQSNDASGAHLPAFWYVDLASGAKSHFQLKLPAGLDYRGGFAFDANSDEQIVGYGALYENGSYNGDRALLWSGPTAVPVLVAGLENRSAVAGAINEGGDAVGYLSPGTSEESVFFFDGATTTFLETLGGPGEPRDVNNHGVVVGVSLASATEPFSSQRAFVSSTSGPARKLPDFGGRSAALAINDGGVIVGYALNAAGESRAVRWTGSISTGYVIEDLGLPRARAWDINSAGEIVGSFVGTRRERGFFRSASGITKELPILSYSAIAYAINENAQIVGISYFRNTYTHAVLWTGAR